MVPLNETSIECLLEAAWKPRQIFAIKPKRAPGRVGSSGFCIVGQNLAYLLSGSAIFLVGIVVLRTASLIQ